MSQSQDVIILFNHITTSLPKVEQDYGKDGHFYLFEGIRYPSITTILHSFPNPGIDRWKQTTSNWQEILQESNEVGTEFHSQIEHYLNNDYIPLDAHYELVSGLFSNLRGELDKINNIKCLEASLYEPNLRISGRVDCVADFDGIPSIIDFKSNRKNKDKYIKTSGYFEQLTAYALMWNHCTNQNIEQGVNLIADWNGGVSVHKIQVKDYIDNLENIIEMYYEMFPL